MIYTPKLLCTGCGACKNICPKDAILLTADGEGFLYPAINSSICIACGLCERVCPQTQTFSGKSPIKAYALKAKDAQLLKRSASGGAFGVLAHALYSSNQLVVVFGASYDDKMRVAHNCALDEGSCIAFHGSKYVQSDTGLTFRQVKQYLEQGMHVLYTGTPCQVDGLRKYLDESKSNYDNLILVDLICHGGASPEIWEAYKFFLAKENHSKLCSISTRSKEYGWGQYAPTAIFENGRTKIQTPDVRSYLSAFFSAMIFRDSCYNCRYARHERISDLTIGDFWGIDNCAPDFADERGVSLVLVNSKKGEELLSLAAQFCELRLSNSDEYLPRQNNLQQPSSRPEDCESMWQCYQNFGFKRTAQCYFQYSSYYRFRYFIKRTLLKLQRKKG